VGYAWLIVFFHALRPFIGFYSMVSDFFHPVVGGVESHIFSLGAELIQRGHRVCSPSPLSAFLLNPPQVIVITHHHPPRIGIRYLPPGLKVYHLPIPPIASGATLPNYLLFLPFFRNIILREKIQLIHAHGSLSSLGHEAIYHAPLFGVRTVFTDHSLFGFGDAVGVLTNKLLAGALRNVDAVICVSHTG
jgi:phosphatidylinositol glycan class A protein